MLSFQCGPCLTAYVPVYDIQCCGYAYHLQKKMTALEKISTKQKIKQDPSGMGSVATKLSKYFLFFLAASWKQGSFSQRQRGTLCPARHSSQYP